MLDAFSGSPWLSVLFLAALAIVLAVCSEADAFVAASLSGFSPVARLAFMVVGPMVDLKLIALQAGTFGRAFAVRFSAATAVVAVVCSAADRRGAAVKRFAQVGLLLLGGSRVAAHLAFHGRVPAVT